MHYYETSAKLGTNIEDAFIDLLKQAIAQKGEEEEYMTDVGMRNRYVPDVIDLDAVKPATPKKCDC